MEAEIILEIITILILSVALGILLIALIQARSTNKRTPVFNTVFVIFLISWIVIEILHLVYLESIGNLLSGLHFVILGLIAIWMNVHFYRVLKKVRENT